MKKIGVCACYNTKNYGSMLQTLATGIKIEELGYDYEIIRYSRKLTPGLAFRSIGRIPEKLRQKKNNRQRMKQLAQYPKIYKGIKKRNGCFDLYMKQSFTKLSPVYNTFSELKKAAKHYYAVLVGSDQLWRPEGYSTGFYNLLFVPDEIKKIAYATSFGVSVIPENKKKIAKRFLERIEYISTRELRGSEIVRELTGREVPAVVDPTLLLTGEEWKKYVEDKTIVDGDYIFCYLLGNNPDQREKVRRFSEQTGIKIVTIPHLDEFVECDVSFGDIQLYEIGPKEFVNLIRHAKYICTDSFHGTVFSILNHKQFVTFNRFAEGSKNSRNSRIDSLLKQTGLEDRKNFSGSDVPIEKILKKHIDYDLVENKLSEMRDRSVRYLEKALKSID